MTRKAKRNYPSNNCSRYAAGTLPYGYEVFLNGNKVEHVVMADTSRGYVKVVSEPVVYCNKGGLATHKIRGRVTVRKIAA
jgi:hypothetical protein